MNTSPINGQESVLTLQSGQAAAQQSDTSFSAVIKSKERTLDDIFEKASATYGVSATLLKAIAKAESNFNPNAVSKSGAVGVMQLMPGTARSLGVTDSYDPEQNIMGGAKYIAQMLKKFDGDVTLALAAYNAGPGAVTKYGGVPPYKETQNYVKTVQKYMGQDLTTPGGAVPVSRPGGSSSASLSSLFTVAEGKDDNAFAESLKEQMILKLLTTALKGSDDEDDKHAIPL